MVDFVMCVGILAFLGLSIGLWASVSVVAEGRTVLICTLSGMLGGAVLGAVGSVLSFGMPPWNDRPDGQAGRAHLARIMEATGLPEDAFPETLPAEGEEFDVLVGGTVRVCRTVADYTRLVCQPEENWQTITPRHQPVALSIP